MPTLPPTADREQVTAMLAAGDVPDQVFGPERERTAHALRRLVESLALSKDESMARALTHRPDLDRRYRAWVTGREHLRSAYYEHSA